MRVERWLWLMVERAALWALTLSTRRLYGRARLGSVVPLEKWRP